MIFKPAWCHPLLILLVWILQGLQWDYHLQDHVLQWYLHLQTKVLWTAIVHKHFIGLFNKALHSNIWATNSIEAMTSLILPQPNRYVSLLPEVSVATIYFWDSLVAYVLILSPYPTLGHSCLSNRNHTSRIDRVPSFDLAIHLSALFCIVSRGALGSPTGLVQTPSVSFAVYTAASSIYTCDTSVIGTLILRSSTSSLFSCIRIPSVFQQKDG